MPVSLPIGTETMHRNSSEAYVLLQKDSAVINNSFFENNSILEMIVLQNPEIVNCIKYHESHGQENAIGDKHLVATGEITYPSLGCMQFQPETFQSYCINKYKITDDGDDIMNCVISMKCADEMIMDGQINQWSVYSVQGHCRNIQYDLR